MEYTYPAHEKLKSSTLITQLFAEGKSVSKYPLRLVFVPCTLPEGQRLQIGVSVSKKHFKKAKDRNYYKRLLRECYRLNKHALMAQLDQPYAMMLFYQSKEAMTFVEMNEKMQQLIEKFGLQVSGS
jgi:ribonuclease P protein component